MDAASTEQNSASFGRTLIGGVLMGLANLVPGISGGTMILAIGLYDRFIAAVADVSRLRLSFASLRFLAIMAVGLAVSILSLSGVAVGLVNEHRWVMYSLFVGLTLGGVPELFTLCRPVRPATVVCVALGIGVMALLAWGLGTQLPATIPVLLLVGAAGASSMILPGVSGSYVLLILGMYDLVIGSLSASALREDFAGSLRIIGPVVAGAVLGIALLSNVLKFALNRYSSASHGLLLGLLLGSVLGLWPFQEPVHADLARKPTRKATTLRVAGASLDDVRTKYTDEEWTDAELEQLAQRWSGRSAGELKRLSEELRFFRPSASQVGASLLLLVVGFGLTRLIGKRAPKVQE